VHGDGVWVVAIPLSWACGFAHGGVKHERGGIDKNVRLTDYADRAAETERRCRREGKENT
jgi:hypothetical protein